MTVPTKGTEGSQVGKQEYASFLPTLTTTARPGPVNKDYPKPSSSHLGKSPPVFQLGQGFVSTSGHQVPGHASPFKPQGKYPPERDHRTSHSVQDNSRRDAPRFSSPIPKNDVHPSSSNGKAFHQPQSHPPRYPPSTAPRTHSRRPAPNGINRPLSGSQSPGHTIPGSLLADLSFIPGEDSIRRKQDKSDAVEGNQGSLSRIFFRNQHGDPAAAMLPPGGFKKEFDDSIKGKTGSYASAVMGGTIFTNSGGSDDSNSIYDSDSHYPRYDSDYSPKDGDYPIYSENDYLNPNSGVDYDESPYYDYYDYSDQYPDAYYYDYGDDYLDGRDMNSDGPAYKPGTTIPNSAQRYRGETSNGDSRQEDYGLKPVQGPSRYDRYDLDQENRFGDRTNVEKAMDDRQLHEDQPSDKFQSPAINSGAEKGYVPYRRNSIVEDGNNGDDLDARDVLDDYGNGYPSYDYESQYYDVDLGNQDPFKPPANDYVRNKEDFQNASKDDTDVLYIPDYDPENSLPPPPRSGYISNDDVKIKNKSYQDDTTKYSPFSPNFPNSKDKKSFEPENVNIFDGNSQPNVIVPSGDTYNNPPLSNSEPTAETDESGSESKRKHTFFRPSDITRNWSDANVSQQSSSRSNLGAKNTSRLSGTSSSSSKANQSPSQPNVEPTPFSSTSLATQARGQQALVIEPDSSPIVLLSTGSGR